MGDGLLKAIELHQYDNGRLKDDIEVFLRPLGRIKSTKEAARRFGNFLLRLAKLSTSLIREEKDDLGRRILASLGNTSLLHLYNIKNHLSCDEYDLQKMHLSLTSRCIQFKMHKEAVECCDSLRSVLVDYSNGKCLSLLFSCGVNTTSAMLEGGDLEGSMDSLEENVLRWVEMSHSKEDDEIVQSLCLRVSSRVVCSRERREKWSNYVTDGSTSLRVWMTLDWVLQEKESKLFLSKLSEVISSIENLLRSELESNKKNHRFLTSFISRMDNIRRRLSPLTQIIAQKEEVCDISRRSMECLATIIETSIDFDNTRFHRLIPSHVDALVGVVGKQCVLCNGDICVQSWFMECIERGRLFVRYDVESRKYFISVVLHIAGVLAKKSSDEEQEISIRVLECVRKELDEMSSKCSENDLKFVVERSRRCRDYLSALLERKGRINEAMNVLIQFTFKNSPSTNVFHSTSLCSFVSSFIILKRRWGSMESSIKKRRPFCIRTAVVGSEYESLLNDQMLDLLLLECIMEASVVLTDPTDAIRACRDGEKTTDLIRNKFLKNPKKNPVRYSIMEMTRSRFLSVLKPGEEDNSLAVSSLDRMKNCNTSNLYDDEDLRHCLHDLVAHSYATVALVHSSRSGESGEWLHLSRIAMRTWSLHFRRYSRESCEDAREEERDLIITHNRSGVLSPEFTVAAVDQLSCFLGANGISVLELDCRKLFSSLISRLFSSSKNAVSVEMLRMSHTLSSSGFLQQSESVLRKVELLRRTEESSRRTHESLLLRSFIHSENLNSLSLLLTETEHGRCECCRGNFDAALTHLNTASELLRNGWTSSKAKRSKDVVEAELSVEQFACEYYKQRGLVTSAIDSAKEVLKKSVGLAMAVLERNELVDNNADLVLGYIPKESVKKLVSIASGWSLFHMIWRAAHEAGLCFEIRGLPQEATYYYSEGYSLSESASAPATSRIFLLARGELEYMLGRYSEGVDLLTEAKRCTGLYSERHQEDVILELRLGDIHRKCRNIEECADCYSRADTLLGEVESAYGEGQSFDDFRSPREKLLLGTETPPSLGRRESWLPFPRDARVAIPSLRAKVMSKKATLLMERDEAIGLYALGNLLLRYSKEEDVKESGSRVVRKTSSTRTRRTRSGQSTRTRSKSLSERRRDCVVKPVSNDDTSSLPSFLEDVWKNSSSIDRAKEVLYRAYLLSVRMVLPRLQSRISLGLAEAYLGSDNNRSAFFLEEGMATGWRHEKMLLGHKLTGGVTNLTSKMEDLTVSSHEHHVSPFSFASESISRPFFDEDSSYNVISVSSSIDNSSLLLSRRLGSTVGIVRIPIGSTELGSEREDVESVGIALDFEEVTRQNERKPRTRKRKSKRSIPLMRNGKDNSALRIIFREFESLFDENSKINKGVDGITIDDDYKREYWGKRYELDARLQRVLSCLQSDILGPWRSLLVCRNGEDYDECINEIFAELLEKISSKFRVSMKEEDTSVVKWIVGACDTITTDEFVSALVTLSNSKLDSLSLLFRKEMEEMCCEVQDRIREYSSHWNDQHVVLCLDNSLQKIPFESIPILRDKSVSRCPTISYICWLFGEKEKMNSSAGRLLSNGVNDESVFYVLNPGGDLLNTQDAFEDWVSVREKWNGIVGKIDDEEECNVSDEVERALESSDLFLYFGHGAGEKLVSPKKIQLLSRCSAAILMGCSSGALREQGSFESRGTVLSYLLAGSPCVVANLWDVTDKDIDRFTMSLLEKLIPQRRGRRRKVRKNVSSDTVSSIIRTARESCKLKLLTGAAPVVYGLPIFNSSGL